MRYFLRSKLHIVYALLTTLVIIAAAVVLPLSGLVARTHAQESVSFTEFPVPTTNSNPGGITTGPDGNLWFTEVSGNKVGTMTPSGTFNEYPVPTSNSGVERITTGPDGNLWFTEPFVNQIGQITPTGSIHEFHVPTSGSYPEDITTGSDGNLWFTEYFGNQIGRITSTGSITEFPLPAGSNNPNHITVGPDGNLWFTEYGSDQIGVMSTSGALIAQYLVPTANSNPGDITLGPDGNLWFIEVNANQIGRITPTGSISEFRVPTTVSHLGSITAGPDGNVWFTEFFAPNIGRITPSGDIQEFPLPHGGAPDGITAGPLHSVWLTDWSNNEIDQALPTTTSSPTGSWITPGDGFSVPAGSTLQLSANAYPAQATSSIQHVDFAVQQQSGAWQTVCPTVSSTNTFGCLWNLAYTNGIPLDNGIVNLRFTIFDSSGTTFTSAILQGTITALTVQQNTTDNNWAGYVVSGTQYTDVKGSWIQPAISCGQNETSYASFWVGLDGSTSKTVEQIGTTAYCNNGQAGNYVWYEMFPAKPVVIFTGLQPGDHAQAEVSYQGNDQFKLSITLSDGVHTWTSSVPVQKRKGAARNSAEWIAEANCQKPFLSLCFHNPWPQFGTVTFTNCSAGGVSIASGPTVTEDIMNSGVFGGGYTRGLPSFLNNNNTGFSVMWVNP